MTFAGVFGLLGAVYLLPPDTALSQVRAAGELKVCLPESYPPLVTGDPSAPGIDVEILGAVAEKLGVRLAIVTNPAMGTDFNPRAWRLTRAQCDILAGGVVGTPTTRSFIDTSPAYIETGWAWLAPHPIGTIERRRIGIYVGVSGLDRVGLAALLRARKAAATVTLNPEELVQGIADAKFDLGVTERLLAAKLAADRGWTSGWLADAPGRTSLVLGLWKGDLTLKRAVVGAMDLMRADGTLAAILVRYAPGESGADSVHDRGH